MPFQIRAATGADSQAAADVVKSVFDEYGFTWDEADYCADLYDLDRYYMSFGHRFWVAEVEGEIAGVVGLCGHPKIPGSPGTLTAEIKPRIAGTDCSLERLYVNPNFRKLGIGSRLTEIVMATAREMNFEAMEIWSDKRFGDAHRLYGRFGAVLVGDRICDDPDRSPEWGLWIRLK